MSVINIDQAIKHLRAEPEDIEDVQGKLDAAEDKAKSYLQRNFYADKEALENAQKEIINLLNSAMKKRDQALLEANNIANEVDSSLLRSIAEKNYDDSRMEIEAIGRGIVINDSIRMACLLALGYFYENRQDNDELPEASINLLTPFRIKWGV